jgi:murein L,D-transpeptidase YafK
MVTRKKVLYAALLLLVVAVLLRGFFRPVWEPVYFILVGMKTVGAVVDELEEGVRAQLQPVFAAAQLDYPPAQLALLVFKEEKRLELWGKDQDQWRHVRDYPVLGASGEAGPKLRQGDQQVPEGIYRISALHPNSAFHLSLKVDYPNEFDQEKARQDGRSKLGGNIFLHGGSSSIGCIALGDPAIEVLFVLVAHVGIDAAQVIIAPRDFRPAPPKSKNQNGLPWLDELYKTIRKGLQPFALPAPSATPRI